MENVNIVKIGSDSINEENLSKLLSDIIVLEDKTKEKFIIISSWAVKLWKQKIENFWLKINNFSKSSLASIGQQVLMQTYERLISNKKLISQILIDDFASEIFLAKTLKNLLENNVFIIINHNDATHNDELENLSLKADNDKNTIHLCKVLNLLENIKIKKVIFLTNTNWLLDDNKNTVLWWKAFSEKEKSFYKSFVKKEKSSAWTWWMESKLDCAFEVLEFWAKESIIANSRDWLDFLISLNEYRITKFYL